MIKSTNIHSSSILIPIAIIPIFSIGCTNKTENNRHDFARQLFERSAVLTKMYIDSLSNASDYTEIQRIALNFNNRITSLNYEFPPDTDLELNEEENDSLIKLNKMFTKMMHVKDSIISHPTVANDSVIINQPEAPNEKDH